MSWGSTWGRVYGGASESGIVFSVSSARASGSHSFRVTFSREPLFESPVNIHDASRISNWELDRLEFGTAVPIMILSSSRMVDDPTVVEFRIADPWRSTVEQYRIRASSSVWSREGIPIDETDALFYGAPAATSLPDQQDPLVDIRNIQMSTDRPTGGLVVSSSGDYEKESGVALLKKLIIRRTFTTVGEFFHLANTDYGAGVTDKTLWTDSDLVTLKRKLEMQYAREGEVDSVNVTIDLYPDSRLVIGVAAQTSFGPLEFTFEKAGSNG